MDKQILKAEKRNLTGRKVKTLRKQGTVPGNVYGRGIKSQSIQVDAKEFEKTFSITGETGLVELVVGSEKKPVLVHNIQKDPVSDSLLHVDFLQVDLKQKVNAEVPLELVGESPAEKQGLGTVVQYLNELEVKALPTDLPDKFEIDLTLLTEVNQMVQVKDIKFDKAKVEVVAGDDEIVVKVEPPKEEKVEVITPVEGEGEAPAEGTVEGDAAKTDTENTKEDSTQSSQD